MWDPKKLPPTGGRITGTGDPVLLMGHRTPRSCHQNCESFWNDVAPVNRKPRVREWVVFWPVGEVFGGVFFLGGWCMYVYIYIYCLFIYIYRYIPRTRMTFFLEGWSGTRYIYKYGVKLYSSSWWYERYWYFIHLSLFKWLNSGKNAAYIGNVLTKEGPIYQLEWWIMLSHRHTHSLLYTSLDLPKGAEWMIRGDHTPSLGSKQNPLEDAGIYTYLFLD